MSPQASERALTTLRFFIIISIDKTKRVVDGGPDADADVAAPLLTSLPLPPCASFPTAFNNISIQFVGREAAVTVTAVDDGASFGSPTSASGGSHDRVHHHDVTEAPAFSSSAPEPPKPAAAPC